MTAYEEALKDIEKQFGKGSVFSLKDKAITGIDCITTGCMSLDLALGGRGLPKGRIIEIFGPESSGKTTLALTVAGEAQKLGCNAFMIDAEHAFDPTWASKLGVDTEKIGVSQPTTGEEALQIAEILIKSNDVGVIIIDSVAALTPKAELEGQIGDTFVGLQSRLMSQAMRKLTGAISTSSCLVIFINQIREKIGVMYGSPETTPGGRALKFYASCRLDIRKVSQVKENEHTILGQRSRVKVVKNKVAAPFREAEFDIMYDCGISKEADLIEVATSCKVLTKRGSWIDYKDAPIGQSKEKARIALVEDRELYLSIFADTLEALK